MSQSERGKVVVAMSGGVDSSLAAALLKERGYEVVGCFMRLGSVEEEGAGGMQEACPTDFMRLGSVEGEWATGDEGVTRKGHGCCSVGDARDAQRVAGVLGIPLYVLNFKAEFGRVLRYFVDEYNAGRTPNPCIRCNEWLKFGRLLEQAESLGARWLATGHYARVEHEPRARLLRGMDPRKDQSYVLFGIGAEALRRLVLPIGELEKKQVREMARQRGLPVHDKPDSQEICFVPDDDYYGLLRRVSPPGSFAPGEVVDRRGKVLARHEGHQQFTIGQRRGLGFAAGQPRYVIEKDAATNRVVVGEREDLLAVGLEASEAHWLVEPLTGPQECTVKIRSNGRPVKGKVMVVGQGKFAVEFEEPQMAVSPGQAAVIYSGEEVLGGGWISRAVRAG